MNLRRNQKEKLENSFKWKENAVCQNGWNSASAVFRGKYVAKVIILEEEKSYGLSFM